MFMYSTRVPLSSFYISLIFTAQHKNLYLSSSFQRSPEQSAAPMASASTISLFRAMMRQARQVNDYNFRSYAVRRVKTGFYMNRDLQG